LRRRRRRRRAVAFSTRSKACLPRWSRERRKPSETLSRRRAPSRVRRPSRDPPRPHSSRHAAAGRDDRAAAQGRRADARAAGRVWRWSLTLRTQLMGIVNVTPDSFSDGGQFFDPAAAIAQGKALAAAGAELLDVGGESTRPGAAEVSEADELSRVIPVIRGLR